MHQGILPREGFCADVILRLVRGTVLNPTLLLPLFLLSRFTKKGQDLSILHPVAAGRLGALLCVSLARSVSGWFSDKVRNNWVDDKYDWSKEIVLVTGGAAGIGAATVRLFDELGVTVVVLDVQPMSFEASSRVHHFLCDIRSPANLADTAERIRAEVGHPTVIINNAGVLSGKTILDAEPEDVRRTFEVNTFAHFWVTKTFLPHLVAHNHGMVVTVSSIASWLTVPNLVEYAASKAAVMAFHEGMSAELKTRYNAPKVRTVVVHPGITKTALTTGFTEMNHFLLPDQEPESIAEAVVKQVLSGRSGQVIMPEAAGFLPAVRVLPDWYSIGERNKGQKIMLEYRGRQVIAGEKSQEEEPSESTVLVSKP